MHLMTGGAALADGFMLENKGTALRRVTRRAGIDLDRKRGTAAFDRLAFMRIVAIPTTNFTFENGMVAGQAELTALIEMTLEAGLGRSTRVYNRVICAAGLAVDAAGPVAGLTPDKLRVFSFGLQSRMCRGFEGFDDVLMTLGTVFRANKLSARDRGRGNDGAGDIDTRRDNSQ
jgi:hypothetical protein